MLGAGWVSNVFFFWSSSELSPPRDLVTDDVTPTSFSASWTPAPGPVREYRVVWKSLVSEETGQTTVPGDQSRTPLEGLTPETLYQVSVVAVYPHGQSPALLGQETTDGESVPLPRVCWGSSL